MTVRCRVLRTLKAENGTVELQAGRIIEASCTEAAPFIQSGHLEPLGPVVYKVWSELLQEHILVCNRDDDRGKIENGDTLTYTPAEIRELRKVKDKAMLRFLHEAKKQLSGTIDSVGKRQEGS